MLDSVLHHHNQNTNWRNHFIIVLLIIIVPELFWHRGVMQHLTNRLYVIFSFNVSPSCTFTCICVCGTSMWKVMCALKGITVKFTYKTNVLEHQSTRQRSEKCVGVTAGRLVWTSSKLLASQPRSQLKYGEKQ